MADLYLNLLMSAQDGISSVLASIGGNFGTLGGIIAGVAAGTVAFGAQSVQAAGNFQSSMESLVTGAGEAQSNLSSVSAGVLKMATDTGTSTDQLSKGLYLIESSGQHGAAGLQTLQAAAEGAKVGSADLGTTAGALTTIMTDYHQPASQATSDMNALTTVVADGKTHLQDLGSSMGAILPLASSLGVSFPQIGGAIAVMTNAGMSAQNASQNLANALRALASPSNKAVTSMQSVGISAQQLKDTLTTQGLSGAIQLIEQHVGQTFPAGSVQAVEAFKSIMGGATGYNVALQLGGQNMAAYEANIKGITAAMDAGGNSVQGWSAVQDTFNFQVQRAQAAFQALEITLGQVFLPLLTQVTGFVADAISGFLSWEQSTGFLQNAMSGISSVIQGVLSLIQGGFSGLPDLATGWGQNMVQGFANGVLSVLDDVIAAVVQVVDEISDYIGFASPSKKGPGVNLLDWGQGMVTGFAQGITDNIGVVTDAASMIANQLAPLGATTTDVATSASGGGVINMSGMTIAQAKQVEALILQNEQLKAAAAKQQATVAKANAASTTAAQKHAATQAATAQKQQAAVAKHQATLAAAAQKQEAAQAKHQATVEAAAKKHQEVLAKQAATAATKAAKSTKAAGGGLGSAVAGALPATPKIPALGGSSVVQQAQAAGQNVASAYARGLGTIKKAVGPELAGLNSFVMSVFTLLAPMIKPSLQILVQLFQGVWSTLKTVGSVIASTLLPAIGNLVSAIAPVVTAIITWIAQSGIIKDLFVALGVVIRVVVTILAGVINAVAAIIRFFTQTQVGIAIFQAVLVLLGLVATVIGVIAGIMLASMIPAFVAWVGGAIAVGVANVIAFAPIVLIVLAIIAVITAVILIIKNWGAIAHWLQGVWADVASFFSGLWAGVVSIFQSAVKGMESAFSAIGGWFSDRWNDVKNITSKAVSGIQTALGNVGNWFHDRGQDAAKGAKSGWDAVSTAYTNGTQAAGNAMLWLYNHNYYVKDAVDAIVYMVRVAIAWLTQAWQNVTAWIAGQWQDLVTLAAILWTAVSDAVQTGWQQAVIFVVQTWQQISAFFANAWQNWIVGPLTATWQAVSAFFQNAWTNWIVKPLTWVWQQVSAFFQMAWSNWIVAPLTWLWQQVSAFFANAWSNWVVAPLTSLWQAVSSFFSNAWNNYVVNPLSSLWNNISNWFSGLINSAWNWGANLISGFIGGINSMLGSVSSTASNVASTVASFLGFHSPAKEGPGSELDTWGPGLIAGFAQGIVRAQPVLQAAINLTTRQFQPLSQPVQGAPVNANGGQAVHNYYITVPAVSTSNTAAAREQGRAIARELANQLRGSGITPTLVSGGLQ